MTELCGLKRTARGAVTCDKDAVHDGWHRGRGAAGQKYVWQHTCGGVRVIRLTHLTDLPADEAIAALACSMEELAIAESLKIIHGERRAAEMYVERGGHIRFLGDEVVLLWSKELMDSPSPFAQTA